MTKENKHIEDMAKGASIGLTLAIITLILAMYSGVIDTAQFIDNTKSQSTLEGYSKRTADGVEELVKKKPERPTNTTTIIKETQIVYKPTSTKPQPAERLRGNNEAKKPFGFYRDGAELELNGY